MITHRELLAGPSSSAARAAVTSAVKIRALFRGGSVLETLQNIVDLASRRVRGCDGASVSFVQGETVVTPVWTKHTVVEVDALQYSSGEGPCLDAIAHSSTFYSPDLSCDPRWPVFGPQASRRGMHSLLSLRLGGGDLTLGSLNLYGCVPDAYDKPDRLEALAFSIHAGTALVASSSLESTTQTLAAESSRLARLEKALSSRRTISLAQGIVMAREGIGVHDAFTLLRRASIRQALKLSEVARRVVETGEIPSGPVEPRR